MKKVLSTILTAILCVAYIGLIGYFAVCVEHIGGVIAFAGICFGVGALIELNERRYTKQ